MSSNEFTTKMQQLNTRVKYKNLKQMRDMLKIELLLSIKEELEQELFAQLGDKKWTYFKLSICHYMVLVLTERVQKRKIGINLLYGDIETMQKDHLEYHVNKKTVEDFKTTGKVRVK